MPVHLSPIIEPAEDAIVVGDPRRAFAIAGAVTVEPKMSHLARGLWGYTGETPAGRRLTVQSTGVGGPGAVAVIGGLAELGVERVVRLGSCVATGPPPGTGGAATPGEAFLIESAIPGDGATAALTGGRRAMLPDPGLSASLESIAPPSRVFSHDLTPGLAESPAGAERAPLRDLQTAATFAITARLGIAAAAILVVAETSPADRLSESELESSFLPLAGNVARALT